MGPGANAQTDKIIMSASHPEIFFWDQPKLKDPAGAFIKLVDAAELEVRKLVQANDGQPVKVVAHSFGGHIFHHLTLRDASLFSSCHFWGTGYDMPAGFYRLMKIMGQHPSSSAEQIKNISAFLETHKEAKTEDVWSYVGLIAQDPAFLRHYWPTETLFEKFVAVASRTDSMDMEAFQNVLSDFFTNHFRTDNLTESPWEGAITIELGDKDPVIDLEKEVKLWSAVFPQAQVNILKGAGHFPHLETPLKT